MKIEKEPIRTIASNGYEIEIQSQIASDTDIYEGMTRLHAESTSTPLAGRPVFTSTDFMAELREEDVEAFVELVEQKAADQARDAADRLSNMHPDERHLAELMAREPEWESGSREAYEAGCEFAGVEAHGDDEILNGAYGIRYADFYMSHYGDGRWKLIMSQRLAASRLSVIEAPQRDDSDDDLFFGMTDDVTELSRDLRANPYNE